jgi:hypothetical protein
MQVELFPDSKLLIVLSTQLLSYEYDDVTPASTLFFPASNDKPTPTPKDHPFVLCRKLFSLTRLISLKLYIVLIKIELCISNIIFGKLSTKHPDDSVFE